MPLTILDSNSELIYLSSIKTRREKYIETTEEILMQYFTSKNFNFKPNKNIKILYKYNFSTIKTIKEEISPLKSQLNALKMAGVVSIPAFTTLDQFHETKIGRIFKNVNQTYLKCCILLSRY